MIERDDDQQRVDDAADTRDLLNRVDFGLETKQFLTSKIGLYVQERAQADMYEASISLTEADPTDTRAIIVQQQQYKVAAAALSWLAEAYQMGIQAEQQFLAREQGG